MQQLPSINNRVHHEFLPKITNLMDYSLFKKRTKTDL